MARRAAHRAPGRAALPIPAGAKSTAAVLGVAAAVPLLTTGQMQAIRAADSEAPPTTDQFSAVSVDATAVHAQASADAADVHYTHLGDERQHAAAQAAQQAAPPAPPVHEAKHVATAPPVAPAHAPAPPRHAAPATPVADAAVSRAATVIAAARRYLGVPYVYGGNGFSGIDCSGLTKAAYAAVGVSLPRVAADQARWGSVVSEAQAQPGDLVSFGSPVHHIAVYLGGGMMIAAPSPGAVVRIQPVYSDHTTYHRIL